MAARHDAPGARHDRERIGCAYRCLDPKVLDKRFAGRRFDETLLAELPANIDPCGENGEFHTVVTAGPMFKAPIAVEIGETVNATGSCSPM